MAAAGGTELGFLTGSMVLAGVLGTLRSKFEGYTIVEHWKQGEFHHDLVLRVAEQKEDLPGDILVVSTNCNGGVKELLCFDRVPDRWALWHYPLPRYPGLRGRSSRPAGPDQNAQLVRPAWPARRKRAQRAQARVQGAAAGRRMVPGPARGEGQAVSSVRGAHRPVSCAGVGG